MRYQHFRLVLIIMVIAGATVGCIEESSVMTTYDPIEVTYPETQKKPVSDVYHEVQVEDAYRWLEDDRSDETTEWVGEQNEATFGYLEQIPFREHNYDLEVKVIGEVDPQTGYLIDLKILKQIIYEEVEQRFDHNNLNLDTEEFRNLNPTAENICHVIWQLLRKRLDENFDLVVRLYETPRNYVEYPA